MKKTKVMIVGFAVFAAFLMLMATCIAGPVREKTSLDAVENEQEELLNSIEAMFLKIENDKEFAYLQSYLESSYSSDMQNINDEFIELLETLIESQNTDIDSEGLELSGFLSADGVIPVVVPDDDLDLNQEATSVNGADSPENLDSDEAQYAGFVQDVDGGMLVPGYGWVYPDDPNWDDFYDLHNSLQGMPMSSATAALELFAEMLGPGTTGIISTLILILLAVIDIIVTAIAVIVDQIISSILSICGVIVGAIAAFVVGFVYVLGCFLNTVQGILDGILAWLRGLLPP